jgi:predicted TIM-barrel fold metal-dependent hydrolase
MTARAMIDCAAYIGAYPFRELPHPDPAVLVRVLAREGLSGAWVGYLPAPWQRDPAPGNDALFAALEPHRDMLRAAPVVRPDWPQWERALREVVERGAAAVRAYPMHWGMAPHDERLTALALACGEIGVPLVLTVRFEDLRQRHLLDVAGDLTAAHVRALARAGAGVRLIVTGAGRELLEETHWGLTPDEQRRVYWDFAWVWGPPEDHFAHLVRTVGAERFVYGTHWPLRLTQNPRANLDLLPPELRVAGITDASGLSRVRKTLT